MQNFNRTIAIGSDHRGLEMKNFLISFLTRNNFTVVDKGAYTEDAVDYPVIAISVAEEISHGNALRGIIIDSGGIGSSIAANKVKDVRAAMCNTIAAATNSRAHNDANIMTLGSGVVSLDEAQNLVEIFLNTPCDNERYLKRVDMITDYEKGIKIMPDTTNIPNDGQNANLTEDDIIRIVARIRELMAENGISNAGTQAPASRNPEDMRHFIGMGVGRITHVPENGSVPEDLAAHIDHTLLKPATTEDDIVKFCEGAKSYPFASVCVNPSNVKLAASTLKGTRIKVCSVVGFPLGAHVPEIKALEARRAIRDGAKEIDMVINIGALKSKNYDLVLKDIKYVVEACRDGSALCKVIIETSMLTDEEKVKACLLAKEARADFVKTSTGMGGGGATAHDVALMSEAIRGTKMQVKASGGIRSLSDAQKMIAAGATRIGAGAGIQIVQEAKGIAPSGNAKTDY